MKDIFAKRVILCLTGGSVGLSLGWLIYASVISQFSQPSASTVLLVASLFYLPAVAGVLQGNSIKADLMPMRWLLIRSLWLIGLSIWGFILGLTIYVGGLDKIKPVFWPFNLVFMVLFYLSSVMLIVEKITIPLRLRPMLILSSAVVVALIPVLFEFISR